MSGKRKLFIGFFVSIIIALLGAIVYAATYYSVGVGSTVAVNEWSSCRKVTNNGSYGIFVPTNTASEWTTFQNNKPASVSLASCVDPLIVSCPPFDDTHNEYSVGGTYDPSSGQINVSISDITDGYYNCENTTIGTSVNCSVQGGGISATVSYSSSTLNVVAYVGTTLKCQESRYAISSCPTVNSARSGTTRTKAEILGNITNYIGCSVSGYTGKIAGYTYSGSKIEANKMVLLRTANEASTYQWGLYGTDLSTLANITANTNTTTMTDNIVAWDGLSNTNKIIASIGAGSTYAAQLCKAKGTNRYLPAIEELNELYCYSEQAAAGDYYYGAGANHADCVAKGYPTTHIGALTGFIANVYWSSTEYNGNYARRQSFTNGYRYNYNKGNASYVRCVSRF